MVNSIILFMSLMALVTTAFGGENLASRICGDDGQAVSLVNDWKKVNDGESAFCADVRCKNEEVEFTRKACIRKPRKGKENAAQITFDDELRTKKSVRFVGSIRTIFINKEDECFESCKPEKTFFGSNSGLDRKTCMECFKNRAMYKEVVNYSEIGRPLEPGTKCFLLCRDNTEGPITLVRTLSQECRQCVGINGLARESFEYMLIKSGDCYEIDNRNYKYQVDIKLCKNAKDLIHTFYEGEKSFFQKMMGQAGDCFEKDDKTNGQILRSPVDLSYCETQSVNDSDRTVPVDKSHKEKGPKASSSSSAQ